MLDDPLSKVELKNVIEGKGAARRIPLAVHNWVYSTGVFGSREPEFKTVLEQYPADIQIYILGMPSIKPR
ncbi:MAG: hypothetical protein LBF95_00320 [Treponema sp.]|jgi:hypothetical protein|nr:hypothetical protein [Treponema sp.]